MATLEKPRTKKKKKTRIVGESPSQAVENSADVELPEVPEELLHVEEISAIAAEFHHPPDLETKNSVEEAEEKPQEEIESPPAAEEEPTETLPEETVAIPSAPPIEAKATPSLPVIRETSTTLYPTLDTLRKEALPFQKSQELEIHVEPFTITQLRDLYSNNLLVLAKELEKEFIETELNPSFLRNDDYLYHCVQEYMQSLTECRNLEIEAERLKGICKADQEKLWSIISVSQKFSGMCSDGNRVSTTVSYKKAIFNENLLDVVSRNFSEIRSTCCDKYVKSATLGALLKMKIDEEIVRIQSQHFSSSSSQEFVMESNDLRRSISILFFFLRKPSVHKIFMQNLKKWLNILVNLLLDVATWPDHMFILHHVLRCPPGIISWAAWMIQIPVGKFSTEGLQNHVCIQHSLTVLQAILLPVTKRSEFLDEIMCWSKVDKSGAGGGGEWSFVDSDGEEDVDLLVLRENDLVAIFNQIPWREIFSLATKMEPKRGGGYQVRKETITAHTVLQFFAFASYVVEILGMGLCTYNTERYRQFTKRLARLVAQCVQYASSVYKIFQGATAVNDVMIRARIQKEFEQVLVRSCDHIYLSRTAGAWQYLVGLPFSQLSPKCIRGLYEKMRAPHFGEASAKETIETKNQVADYSLVEIFEANDVSQEDLHYLLQTLANLASVNENLRQNIMTDLLEIGFLRGSTKHDCSKIARDLIANLADDCPDLISDVILQFQENILEGRSYGTYLLKRLPMAKWTPGPGVVDVLEEWLLQCPLESPESGMARIVINNMNWGYAHDGRLFLHPALHTRTAMIIYRAAVKNSSTPSNFIAENVKNLVMDKTTITNFHTWCWKMISMLKLHAIDRENPWGVIYSPEIVLPQVPELEHLTDVWKGIKEDRNLATYISILLTQRGHSIPQISTYSFRNMEILFKTDDQVTALRCLQVVFPLFLACPESLIQNPAFHSLLHQIFSVDNSYTKVTIDIVFSRSISGIIGLFGKMIVTQFMDYQRFGLSSPTPLILLWLQCLTKYRDYKNSWNTLYILDVVLEFAFTVPEAWFEARNLFFSLTTEARLTATPTKSVSSFLSKTTSIGLIPNLPVTTIWLGLMVFDVQQEIFEGETGFWQEFVQQLSLQSSGGKNLDGLVKKVASSVGSPHTQVTDLVFSKLANLIISCPTSHTILVILCQRFFALYLTRLSSGQGGVRDRLYKADEMMMRRIKGQLEHARAYHETQMENEKEVDEILSRFHGRLEEMFRTFGMWLEGKDCGLDENLRRLLYSRRDWTEFINLGTLLRNQRQSYEEWNAKIGRQIPKYLVPLAKSASQEYSQKIEKQLLSYDTPIGKKSIEMIQSGISLPSPAEYIKEGLISGSKFSKDFNLLEKYAKTYASDVKEICQLDMAYGKLERSRMVNEQEISYRFLSCTNVMGKTECSGPANVRITQNRVITVAASENQIAKNRQDSKNLLDRTMTKLEEDLLRSLLRIEQTLKILGDKCGHRKKDKCSDMCRISFEIFFKTLKASSDFLSLYPPTRSLTKSVIRNMKYFMPSHLSHEGQKLVEVMVKGSIFTELLIELFTPEHLPPREFLAIYEFTVAAFGNWSDQESIGMILERFSVSEWLQIRQPQGFIREDLTQLILRGLKVSYHRNSPANDKILRSHLIQLFCHQFPQNYNGVLKNLFEGFTKLGLSGDILMDLLNVLFNLAKLEGIQGNATVSAILETLEKFSREQKILTQVELVETIRWLSEFFSQERTKEGIYGLHPKFKHLLRIINIFMVIVLQSATTATILAFPGASADQLTEWIWPCIQNVYEMWLIPIVLDAAKVQSPTNWLKTQMDGVNPVLLPWSESTRGGPDELLDGFTRCTIYAIDSIPGSNSILKHIFLWYEKNFSSSLIPSYITVEIHESLKKLPWGYFDPSTEILDMTSRIFRQKCSVSSINFVSYVLRQVPWTSWLQVHQTAWNFTEKCQIVSLLFSLFISMAAYGDQMAPVLEEINASFPWEFVDNTAFTDTLNIFTLAAGPQWCSKLQANPPVGSIEKAVWKLLKTVSKIDLSGDDAKSARAVTKRLVYVKTIQQFLTVSVNKGKEFFTTGAGQKVFQGIFQELMKDVQKILEKEEEFPKEGLNILVEMVREIPQEADSTSSKLLVEGFTSWETANPIAVTSLLHAIAMSRKASEPVNALLEVTIEGCFTNASVTSNIGWKFVQEILWTYMTNLRPAQIGQESLHCLHLWVSIGLKSERDIRKRFTLKGLVFERLNGVKMTDENELKVALLWGFLCTVSFRECDQSPENGVFLVHVTKRLMHLANEPDDWGKSVLNAIGLTRLKRSKVLWKCLACYMAEMLKVINIECDLERERCALNVELQAKQFNPYREAISQISHQISGDLSQQGKNIASILRKFYGTDNLLSNIELLWT